MTTIGPTLTTARLILRPQKHEDFAAMAEEGDSIPAHGNAPD